MDTKNEKDVTDIAENNLPGLIECLVCREEIKNGARKCINCDSYQDWRRYFQFNIVVLSLLVALISVLTASIPIVKSMLTPISQAKFSFIDYQNNKISVVATNTGQKAVILQESSLILQQVNDSRKVPLIESAQTGKRQFLLKPNEWIEVTLVHKDIGDDLSLIRPEDYKSCRLDFVTLNMTHKIERVSINIPCFDLLGK